MAAGEHEGSSVKYNYDVFFSSSPRDVYTTNHLYKALVDAGFRIVRDGDLIVRSADIKSEVKKLIDPSKISVVVLSTSYVSSKWCLDQLVMITEAKKNLILPVFYDVAPSGVGEALSRFEDQWKTETDPQIRNSFMNKVKEALSFAANVRRFSLPNQALGDESLLIKEFIEAVEEKVNAVEEDSAQMEAETALGELLNQEEPSSLAEDWTATEISLMNIEELPENPHCPSLVKLIFQESNDLTEIPDFFFESMPVLQILDLSNTSIKSLPRSIASLKNLRDLFLRGCMLLTKLPPEIGELSNLEVFDLEGTELIYLPKEIGWLHKLKCLKFSLYKCADEYIERKGIEAIIPRATLSKFSELRELSIFLDPDCKWWDAEVEAIINELPLLRNLETLELYFPSFALLQKFVQLSCDVYGNLSNFLLTIGRHEQQIISSLPCDIQSTFKKLDRCLICVNGNGNTDVIGKILIHAKALFLDRQWTMEKLFKFKIDEMRQLEFCLVVECNEMSTIVDGDDLYQECDNSRSVLESLRYLSVHSMKNLRTIWRGPFVSHCDCLSSLQILAIHTCPELTTIFNLPLLLNLTCLQELIVESCPKVKNIVSCDLSGLEADTYFLPALKKILIVDLPELVSISGGLRIGPKLESIVFSDCPMLKNLSPMDMYIKYMHEIKDESEWLNEVESSNMEVAYLRDFGPLTSYYDFTKQMKSSENAPVQDQLSFESAEKIILRWDSKVSKESKDGMIFGSDEQEANLYLQAVDEIQRSIHVGKMKDNVIIQIAMARLEEEFRNLLTAHTSDTSLTETDSLDESSFFSHSSFRTGTSFTETDSLADRSRLSFSSFRSGSFRRILHDSDDDDDAVDDTNTMHELDLMPPETINDLRSIAERMISAGYMRECVQVYCSVRESAVYSSFRRLVVERLGDGDVQKLEWQVLQMKITRWIKAAKVCVRNLFASEKKFCEKIFKGLGTTTTYDACFMETVKGPVNHLFNFAEAISVVPPSPEKLFRILDLHNALSDLMPDIDVVFNSRSLESIRVQEIQSHLAEISRRILAEIENAVLRESSRVPLPGGSVHPLARYVMNYIILILDYKETLFELIVSKPETDMNLEEDQQSSNLALHLIWIIVNLQSNLEEKSKFYEDASLANLFIMNNVHYIVHKINGSPGLREMIGGNYLKKLTGKYIRAATSYERSTWARVLHCLRDEGLYNASGGPSKSVLRERFTTFNAMFDEVHKTQATWLVPDAHLREELRISISQKLISCYRSFIGGRFNHLISNKWIKYSVEDLETALLNLFEGFPVSEQRRRKSKLPESSNVLSH